MALGPGQGQRGDEGGGDQVGEDVEVQRHRLGVELEGLQGVDAAQPLGDLEQQGGQAGGQGEGPVGGHQRQRVGGLQLVGADEVGDRRLLGRRPQQRHDLEQERGDDEAPEVVDPDQCAEHHGPADVAEDHHLLAVPAVDEDTAHRRQKEARCHPGHHHDADRGPRRGAAAHPGGEGEDGHEAHPVAERRRQLGQPEAQERPREQGPGVLDVVEDDLGGGLQPPPRGRVVLRGGARELRRRHGASG